MSGVLKRLFRHAANQTHDAENPFPPGLDASNASVKGHAPRRCVRGATYDVPDLIAGIRWYGEVFGLRVRSKTGDTASLDATGEAFRLHAAGKDARIEPRREAVFAVENLSTVKDRLKVLGANLLREDPPEDGASPVLVYVDPWGNELRLTASREAPGGEGTPAGA